jgi:predicted nuclease with RNAse H fold
VGARARQALIVAGIDVGAERKGFHAVALTDGALLGTFTDRDPAAIAAWCEARGAMLVGVDAPAAWSVDGRMRPAERALNAAGIRCFASPTRAAALAHPKGWYDWMLNGERLYAALSTVYARYRGGAPGRHCFETFPQAIAVALLGGTVSARDKRVQRPRALASAGVDPTRLAGIDFVDAGLCAVAADRLARGCARCFGGGDDPPIVVPVTRGPGPTA